MTFSLYNPDSSALGEGQEAWQEADLRTVADVGPVVAAVAQAMARRGYSRQDCFAVRLALDEALVNAVKHGNRGDPAKRVRFGVLLGADQVLARVEDEGPGFSPRLVPDPCLPENREREGGRGVFLMRSLLTWISYNDRGNCVTLCKRRSA